MEPDASKVAPFVLNVEVNGSTYEWAVVECSRNPGIFVGTCDFLGQVVQGRDLAEVTTEAQDLTRDLFEYLDSETQGGAEKFLQERRVIFDGQ